MSKNPRFSFGDREEGEDRLRELMLYVARRCADDTTFGAVKLNKILWWSDFLAFAERGEPITGVEYQSLENGPAPKRLLPIRDELISNGDAEVSVSARGQYRQDRLVPLREPNLDVFTSAQIALVDKVIDDLWQKTAADVSRLSHGKAWEVAGYGNSIPYEAIFLSDDPVDPSDVARTKELAAHQGWARE